MEPKKKSVTPEFGKWEEEVQYTSYFEKTARPTPAAPNPNQTADQGISKRPATAGEANAADYARRRVKDHSRNSASQRSVVSEPELLAPPSSSRGQFRPSAITWELRNTNRDEIVQRNNDEIHSSSTSRQNHRGGRGGGIAGATPAFAAPVRNYPAYEDQRYGRSAPTTPQHGFGTPSEMKGQGGVPEFGGWNRNETDYAISDTNFTMAFEKIDRGKREPEKQAPPMPRQPIMTPPADLRPRPLQPTFLPEVQRRPTPPRSPSYHHVNNNNNNGKNKKNSARCWPFRFSSK